MSITKGVWKLQEVRDQILASEWVQYDNQFDPSELWAWGNNNSGQLGDDTTIDKSSPVQIPGTEWNFISAGFDTALARKTDGTLWAWGNNFNGQIGDNTRIDKSSPVQIPGTKWFNLSNGASHSLARKLL